MPTPAAPLKRARVFKERGWWLAMASLPLLVVAVYVGFREPGSLPEGAGLRTLVARDSRHTIGGVSRPSVDIQYGFVLGAKTAGGLGRVEGDDLVAFPYGRLPSVDPDSNAQVASVAEALAQQAFPERLSVYVAPAPFDRDEYTVSPQDYLNVHEPGRVFQSAQPGPGVPVLRPVSAMHFAVTQGESVRLQVETLPGMPATFTSFDAGAFENGLASITTMADEDGIASAAFTATPGTLNSIRVLAASPVATESVKFELFVSLPD